MAEKIIKQGGKTYIFNPGENGSLTEKGEKKEIPSWYTERPHVAKLVPCATCSGPVSTGETFCNSCGSKQVIPPTPPVGSTRG